MAPSTTPLFLSFMVGVALISDIDGLQASQTTKMTTTPSPPPPPPSRKVSTRRSWLSVAIAGGTASATTVGQPFSAKADDDGPYELPPLPYDYKALAPYISEKTMKLHHDKHHQVYINNANKAAAGMRSPPSLVQLQKSAIKAGPLARNGGGGAYNHDLFWQELGPPATNGAPSVALAAAIDQSFGSMEAFQQQFSEAATKLFGSGWVCVTKDKKLVIVTTKNQDNPLMDGWGGVSVFPILGIDVWEHAYYLDYNNRRPEYVAAFWKVVNWNRVSTFYGTVLATKRGVEL